MYAIIKTGGKQFRVEKDGLIDVELLHAEEGARVEFEALFVSEGDKQSIGTPIVSGFTVIGEVIGSVPGPKVTSVKYKPNHRQYRKFGHRQRYSRVKITEMGKKDSGKEHGKGKEQGKKEKEHALKETTHGA